MCYAFNLLKKNNIKNFHDFNPYENDSNILACILRKQLIYIYKYPSPGPLSGHNDIIIADCLVTSNSYHLEEIANLKRTIFAGKVSKWIPEFSIDYIDRYYKKNLVTRPKTIAFYSSASWLRKSKKQHKAVVAGSMEESGLLEVLKEYLAARPDLNLIVFLHPMEKELFEQSTEYYNSVLKVNNFTLADPAIKSAFGFELADVAVGVYSTLLFERLFCGFKTLFFPYAVKNFPIPGSSLNNICFKDKNIFLKKLDESLELNANDFFEKNNIKDYIFSGWNRNENFSHPPS